MSRTPVLPATLAVGVLVLTAGCSASVNFTVSPDSLAEHVATELQAQVGVDAPPTIDCGDESIDVVEGEVVMCELTEDGSPDIYPVTVTITEVEGTNYSFDIKVADAPQ
ncbi:MAG: DUF4333 domain-containing protein [Cellulomonadaceae bacterium]